MGGGNSGNAGGRGGYEMESKAHGILWHERISYRFRYGWRFWLQPIQWSSLTSIGWAGARTSTHTGTDTKSSHARGSHGPSGFHFISATSTSISGVTSHASHTSHAGGVAVTSHTGVHWAWSFITVSHARFSSVRAASISFSHARFSSVRAASISLSHARFSSVWAANTRNTTGNSSHCRLYASAHNLTLVQ